MQGESQDDLESSTYERGLLQELVLLNLNQIKDLFGKIVMQFEVKKANSEMRLHGLSSQTNSQRGSLLLESSTGGAESYNSEAENRSSSS